MIEAAIEGKDVNKLCSKKCELLLNEKVYTCQTMSGKGKWKKQMGKVDSIPHY